MNVLNSATTLATTTSTMVFLQPNVHQNNTTDVEGGGGGGGGGGHSNEHQHLADAYKVLLYGFLSGLTLITILGNTLVIVAVATTRRLRSVTNCFIVSLSVADLLVGCLVMPLSLVYDMIDRWPFGVFLCELWSSLDIMLCTASIINLCCISLDRYFAITRPLTYTVKRNKRLALGMIAVVWVTSTAVTCPPLLGWFDRGENDAEQCRYVTDLGYVIFSACGSFYIPLGVMLFVYTRIFVVIYRRNKVVKQQKQYQKSTCCTNGCLKEFSEKQLPTVARGGNSTGRVAVHREVREGGGGGGGGRGHGAIRSALKGSYRDLRMSQSECLVSLEMVSDSLLAIRPRCDSNTEANGKRDSQGGLYRSRSYQFQFRTPSKSEAMNNPCKMAAVIAASTATPSTHLLAVPQWNRGPRTPSSSSSGALNVTTSSSGGGYTESTCLFPSSASSEPTRLPKASLPALGISSDDHSDLLRVSSTRPPHVHRDLRRKHVRGLRMSFRKETKATTTIAVVVGGFVVCWLPFFIIYILNPFCDSCNFSRMLVSSLTWLGWANSAVNPFIYAFYNMDFRSAFWRLTIGRCRKNPEEKSKAVVVYPQVWRSRLKNARVNGLPSIVMVQSDVM